MYFIDLDCEFGTYGANCSQSCSNNCLNNMCDQYTGICLHGCSDGYVLPYCRESKIQNFVKNQKFG